MSELTTAFRSLRKSPGFAAAVILTLAIAIGANSVIFSAVETVLLRPFPVRDIDRIVDVGRRDKTFSAHYGLNSGEIYDLEKRHDLFDAVGGYRTMDLNVAGAGNPVRAAGVITTPEFFRVFGVRAYIGRFYDDPDQASGATNVAVLSYDFWMDFFGGDRAAVGRSVRINDSSFTVIGVLPPRFAYPLGGQLWTPRPLDPLLDRSRTGLGQYPGAIVPTVARMHGGMTLPSLQQALTAAAQEWARRLPEIYADRAEQPIEARALAVTTAGILRPILIALIGAVGLVLVIACANIATLQLLRASARTREVAVRMALGATRWSVVRLFAAESGLLAVAGGALGVLLCAALVATVGRNAGTLIPELQYLRLDARVVAWSAAATLLAAVLFGVAPALQAVRGNTRDLLSATSSRNASSGRGRVSFLNATIVAQVAIALMLVLSCGAAVRSLIGLLHVNPGFDADGVITARVVLPRSRYGVSDIASARRLFVLNQQLVHRVREVPGFSVVGTADVAPFSYRGTIDAAIHGMAVSAERGPDAMKHAIAASVWLVDADYLRALRIPLIKGPGFTGTEESDWLRDYPNGGPSHVVIDETLARRLFGDADPIGKEIDAPYYRVVGVVGSIKKSDLTATADAGGAIYVANAGLLNEVTFVIRTPLSLAQATARLRDAVHDFDPQLPVFDVVPLSDIVARSVGSRRVAVWLLAALAGVSLFLAVFGIYAVLSYATTQRTKEIGIRLALGASPREIVALVTRSSATLTCTGLAFGVVGYWLGERGMTSLTYGVSPNDPRLVVGALFVLAAAALLASLPAVVRATRVNPVEALRSE